MASALGCGDNIKASEDGDPDAGDGPGPGEPDAGPGPGEIDAGTIPGCDVNVTGPFDTASAHWLNATTLALPQASAGESFELRFGDCQLLTLTPVASGLPEDLRAKFPHLAGYRAYTIEADEAQVKSILQGPFFVIGKDAADAVVTSTGVQTPGVIDSLYAYDGPLGLSFSKGQQPAFRLWAPTARGVTLQVFDDQGELADSVAMTEEGGVWTHENAPAEWYGRSYKYQVDVFSPYTWDYPANNLVTDPYSVALTENSGRSLIVDLADPATKPEGWDEVTKPALEAPEDIVVYETHVRDFSINDLSVPLEHRGKFLAFTHDGTNNQSLSNGMSHLIQLQNAGLTHVHLLPAFDIATVAEDPEQQINLDSTLSALCAAITAVTVDGQDLCTSLNLDSTIRAILQGFDTATGDAQELMGYIRGRDGFNWGYDPLHYGVPEGSYATNSDGVNRVLELRSAVQALARNDLRVVMDVVYNHTHASGFVDQSVLDRIVPGYYHRRDPVSGAIANSTCCQNTASEHTMMEKLMVDTLIMWATQYKIDGFRFDLMGHHLKFNMETVKTALQSLTQENDGVDGSSIYLYGEGWDFGEVGGNQRGQNATQFNLAGTGIGTFSDRLRDAVRGGGPFDSGATHTVYQGFISGMAYDPNPVNTERNQPELMGEWLSHYADIIRLGMAGNLADFVLVDRANATVTGSDVCYGGGPAGYTQDPQEHIVYVDKHDNQTLFDITQYKLPASLPPATRVRVQNLGNSIVLLSQGIPFIHMGQDMLRSKSMERDSYDSGDWFNRVDFTYQSNNWNVGLPRFDKDGANWPYIEPLLGNNAIKMSNANITAAVFHFREMLRVRKSSKLFRLETKEQVMQRVDFLNPVGDGHIPGLIVMSITDGTCAGDDLDPSHHAILVFINANDQFASFTLPGVNGFALHPVLATSADLTVRQSSFNEGQDRFFIPARTTAVFVQAQAQGSPQGEGLPCNTRVAAEKACSSPAGLSVPPPPGLIADVYVRGTMNNWTAPDESKFVQDPGNSELYHVSLTLTAGTYQFKVADANWGPHNWGIDGGSITANDGVDHVLAGSGDISLTVPADGSYRFTLDITNIGSPTIRVSTAE